MIRMCRLIQTYDSSTVEDIPTTTRSELDGAVGRAGQTSVFGELSGKRIAVCAGSRGINRIAEILKSVVDWLKGQGAAPFIVPAMGSHGGATAEGQAEVLSSYGITEEAMGVPVRSSMETVELPADGIGNRVFMDRLAYEADGTIVVNRIKAHTDFQGDVESGLLKMASIGLGKRDQAVEVHSFGIDGLKNRILPTARQVLQHGNIILGIGIVENAHDRTMRIVAILPAEIEKTEAELLRLSRDHMPTLPVDDIDVLVVDELGKDISGVGLDTTIIGRMRVRGQPEPDRPSIKQIVVTDLTASSHGNAVGMGLADVITERFRRKIDFESTYMNGITSSFYERCKMPIVGGTDQQSFEIALRGACIPNGTDPRIVRIKNTLTLTRILASEAVARDPQITAAGNIAVLPGTVQLFTDGEDLASWDRIDWE